MKLRFLSLMNIMAGIKLAVRRFPIPSLVALISTVVAITLFHNQDMAILARTLMVFALAFPLYVAVVLLAEQQRWKSKLAVMIDVGAAIFLVIYFLLLPQNIFAAEHLFFIRYALWAIGFILLVTFIAFLSGKNKERILAFWQYNRHLVYSAALTVIWAFAIWAGLSIAMASVDFLFNINIDGDRYAELWIVVVGLFSTIFFLARLPKETQQFEQAVEYPKELRLFSQYVLVPLVSIYFLILYAYVVRILVTAEWPEGTLAYMILGFSLLGVLTYIALYPLRQNINWVRKVGNWYYVALIPQVGMLFWALWFRIKEYAFTENRYFVMIFGGWLLIMALYFLISKRKDIRIVPITLFFIAVLSSFGPWGAFAVSEHSQINRLEGLLVKNDLLVDGSVKKAAAEVPVEDEKEISAIIRYLYNVHNLDGVEPWFGVKFDSLDLSLPGDPKKLTSEYETDFSYRLPEKVVEDLLGIDYLEQWEGTSLREDGFFAVSTDFTQSAEVISITGYDYFVQLQGTNGFIGEIEGADYRYEVTPQSFQLEFYRDDNMIASIDLNSVASSGFNLQRQVVDPEDLMVEYANDVLDATLYFSFISGEQEDASITSIHSLDARMFFRVATSN